MFVKGIREKALMIVVILVLQIILPILTVITQNVGTVISIAEDLVTEDGFTYTVKNNEVTITKYVGTETEVEIPETIQGMPVVAIGERAFYSCRNVTDITIPDSVTTIGSGAFSSCNSVINFIIPHSVTQIGTSAFEFCSSLTAIDVDINNESYSSQNGVLFDKEKTSLIHYPPAKQETEYEISNSVTTIEYSAFMYCNNLTNITIPDSVTTIKYRVFYHCEKLVAIEVDVNNENYSSENGILFNKEKTKLICYPMGKQETEYHIPDTVTTIESYAFSSCNNLTNIIIPDSVTTIGGNAFSYCNGLTNITIPDSVTTIESYAFAYCNNLTNIAISDSVMTIGSNAFANCINITNVILPNSLKTIGMTAFMNCIGLTSIMIPAGVTDIGNGAFSGCSSLTDINVHEDNSNYSSEDGVLFDKDKSKLLQYPSAKEGVVYQIPNGVNSIETLAFVRTINSAVIIPEGLNQIKSKAFAGCNMTGIMIPNSVVSIEKEAFSSCPDLRIYTFEGSYAETYAIENNIPYEYTEELQFKTEIIQFEDAIVYNKMIEKHPTKIVNKDDDTYTIEMINSDIDSIKEIVLFEINAQNIKGIEKFENLENVGLILTHVEDISPLSGLSKLERLDASGSRIKDISPVQNLKNLKWLFFEFNNEIEDISVLQNLDKLEILSLNGNKISNIDGLEKLTNLKKLYIGENQISNIDKIGELVNLEVLVLSNNRISDISEIAKLTKLKTLVLGGESQSLNFTVSGYAKTGNLITDISPIENLVQLETLRLDRNNIKSIEGISKLTNLKELYINHNHISDISEIQALTKLENLYMEGQTITKEVPREQTGTVEIELPQVFIAAKEEGNIAYTNKDFILTNCTLSEDGTKIIVDTEKIEEGVSIKIDGGKLDKTELSIVLGTEKDTNNNLASLTLNAGTLTPTFNKEVTSYTVAVENSVTSITIGATLESSKATFVTGYGPRTVSLNVGENIINVKVKAEDDTVKTYTIVVTRQAPVSNEITSPEYEIDETKCINKVKKATTIESFLENINVSEGSEVKIYTANDVEITNPDTLIGTGMKVKVNGQEEYTVIVTGDVTGDGKITATDSFKLKQNLVGIGTPFQGVYLKALDVNYNGKVTITDLLLLKQVIVGLRAI
jgi:Leucine-rich repeat (LRR) protein